MPNPESPLSFHVEEFSDSSACRCKCPEHEVREHDEETGLPKPHDHPIYRVLDTEGAAWGRAFCTREAAEEEAETINKAARVQASRMEADDD